MTLHFLLLVSIFVCSHGALAQIRVVTSFSVLEDLVKTIGDSHVLVTNLVPPGEDPHRFEPKPQHLQSLREAQVIFANGLDFEPWLDKIVISSKTRAPVQVVSIHIKPRKIQNHNRSFVDPHAWNSFRNLNSYIDVITRELSEQSPLQKATFRANAQKLKTEIQTLFDRFQADFKKIPKTQRTILVTHNSASYLCSEFEIQALSPLGLSTIGEPSTKELMAFTQTVQKLKIRVLFREKNHQQILAQKISERLKIDLGPILYLDGLSSADGPASTVTKMLEHNLSEILLVLKK